ncbi:RmlC-like cupin [Pleurotus eryngii]|uniref:RmlC-like cupin n=1 Tax=Pleurotus eryngii TaxID=5323 RepID=A0A9P6A884_PLEER|nr:RmlC-like cupin [Pleurotus eryngii]
MSSNLAPIKFVPRRSGERGHADHGWLKTFHTFSFAMYQSNEHNQFGSLRVINEDRVAPGRGFGTHSHREFEIFSYIVAGELEHKDSMGNTEILKRGDIQLTSAGKGISHSEKAHGTKEVHFLQIWSLPSIRSLTPKYFTRHFSDEEKKDVLVRVVAPVDAERVIASREGAGPAPVQSPLTLFATLLSPSISVSHTFERRKSYIHVVQTSGYQPPQANTGGAVKILEKGIKGGEEVVLREGDGAYMLGESGKELVIENLGDKVAEILLFDLE